MLRRGFSGERSLVEVEEGNGRIQGTIQSNSISRSLASEAPFLYATREHIRTHTSPWVAQPSFIHSSLVNNLCYAYSLLHRKFVI